MKYILNTAIFENVSNAKKFLTKLRIPLDDENFTIIKDMLRSAPGYTLLFTRFFFNKKNPASIEELTNLFSLLKELKPLLNNLPKQIDQYEEFMSLFDDLMNIESHIRFNKAISEIPSLLKKSARDNKEYFSLVTSMQDIVLQQYIIFLKSKSSAYKTIESLIEATSMYISSFVNNEEVLKKIEKTPGAKLISNKDNIIIAHIETESASKALGSPSWCIVSRGMWSSYINIESCTKQYFLWNYNVPISDNDFQLGTTIELNGVSSATHLKNDYKTSLNSYCEKYNIDKSLFTPLTKTELVKWFSESTLKPKNFEKIVELDIWKELIDHIPLSWRIPLGLIIDSEIESLTELEKIIWDGNSKMAYDYVVNDGEFKHDYERFQLLDRFDFTGDLKQDELDVLIKKVLIPATMSLGDLDGGSTSNNDWNYELDQYSSKINVYITRDDYIDTIGVDEYLANLVESKNNYHGSDILGDESEEVKYFNNYLSNEGIQWLCDTFEKMDINLKNVDDSDGEWYNILSNIGFGTPINDFMNSIFEMADDEFENDLRKANDCIIFSYDNDKMEMSFANIILYLSRNPNISTIREIIEDVPNDVSSMISEDNIYFSYYTNNLNIEELIEKLKVDIEDIMENNDDIKDIVSGFNIIIEKLVKIGFGRNGNIWSIKRDNISIDIYEFDKNNLSVIGVIRDNLLHKKRNFKIGIEDLNDMVYNEKLDFFYEAKINK